MTLRGRTPDVAFFGATTASVSHELKNVVTIINETAGLLHDLTLAADRGRPLDTGRVRKIASDVSGHVARAVQILNRLNRFAHTTDEPVQSVDLGRLLEDVVGLAARPASLRGATLEARLPERPVVVQSGAFALHQLLTLGLRVGFLATPAPALLTIAVECATDLAPSAPPDPSGPAAAIVRVRPVPREPSDDAARSLAELCALGAELGVTAAIVPDDRGGASMEIRVPAGLPRSLDAIRAGAGT